MGGLDAGDVGSLSPNGVTVWGVHPYVLARDCIKGPSRRFNTAMSARGRSGSCCVLRGMYTWVA